MTMVVWDLGLLLIVLNCEVCDSLILRIPNQENVALVATEACSLSSEIAVLSVYI